MKQKRNQLIIFITLCFISALFAVAVFCLEAGVNGRLTVICKAAASLSFFLIPCILRRRLSPPLLFGMIADIMTEIHLLFPSAIIFTFTLGACMFIAEYICLIMILLRKGSPAGKTLLLFALTWGGLSLMICFGINEAFPVKLFGILYSGVLLFLCMIAADAEPDRSGMCLCLGSLLIFLSDVALVLNRFVFTPGKILGALNYIFYYPGQYFIAAALIASGRKESADNSGIVPL